MALLCIVVWFWMAKGLEPLLAKRILTWEIHREGHRDYETSQSSILATAILGPIFFLLLLFL